MKKVEFEWWLYFSKKSTQIFENLPPPPTAQLGGGLAQFFKKLLQEAAAKGHHYPKCWASSAAAHSLKLGKPNLTWVSERCAAHCASLGHPK